MELGRFIACSPLHFVTCGAAVVTEDANGAVSAHFGGNREPFDRAEAKRTVAYRYGNHYGVRLTHSTCDFPYDFFAAPYRALAPAAPHRRAHPTLFWRYAGARPELPCSDGRSHWKLAHKPYRCRRRQWISRSHLRVGPRHVRAWPKRTYRPAYKRTHPAEQRLRQLHRRAELPYSGGRKCGPFRDHAVDRHEPGRHTGPGIHSLEQCDEQRDGVCLPGNGRRKLQLNACCFELHSSRRLPSWAQRSGTSATMAVPV